MHLVAVLLKVVSTCTGSPSQDVSQPCLRNPDLHCQHSRNMHDFCVPSICMQLATAGLTHARPGLPRPQALQ